MNALRAACASSVASAAALVLALSSAACSKAPDPEHEIRFAYVKKLALAEDAGIAWRLTSNNEWIFDDGWAPLETERGVRSEAWRWMGRTSLLRMKNHDRPMRLAVTGWVPLGILGSPPTMTLRWNGIRMDSFIPPAGRFTRELTISADMQARGAYSDLWIETSSTASERNDPRELGFAIAALDWSPQEP
jgi:hypothetical protein